MAAAKKGRAGKPVERAAKSESRLKKSYDTVNRTIAGAKESAFKRADKSKMRKKRRAAGETWAQRHSGKYSGKFSDR